MSRRERFGPAGGAAARISRRALLGAWAGATTAVVAACNRPPEPGTPAGQSSGGAQRGTLTFMSWTDLGQPQYQAYYGWLEREYAARFPGASFKHEIVSFDEYPTKFTVMAAGGTVPDVMSTSNAWMRDFWALGGLKPLDDLVRRHPDLAYSKFVPASAFYGMRQGKIAGVPTGGPDSEVTLVNTQYFQEAGLDPSYEKLKAWTWDDFDLAADKLTVRRGGTVERAGYQVKVPDGRHLAVWMYSQGGRLYNKDYTGLEVNNEQGVRVFEHLLLLLNGKQVSLPLGANLTNTFLEGRAAMVQGGNWQVTELRLKNPQLQFDMIAYPRHPRGGQYATATWVNMHTIPTAAARADQAWEFLTWFASLPGALKRLELLDQYSPRLDFFDSAEWKARVKEVPQLQRTQDVAAVGGERPGLRFDEMESTMRPIMTAVMHGQTAPSVAVAELEQVTRPLLMNLPPAAR
ncbi:MAG TPA: extracellular solute-binding protein [Chloroflexota bacterium]|nr:extracellular solute-binding protein [Chloroflexota bacterium]